MPFAPQVTLNAAAHYDIPIGAPGKLTAGAQYDWKSRVYFSEFNLPIASQNPAGKLNLTLIYDVDQNWSVGAYARNVTPHIDPRIKAVFGAFELPPPSDFSSREELLAQEASPEREAAAAGLKAFCDAQGSEDVAPSAGLRITTLRFVSAPDGNTVQILYIRPDDAEVLPCVYYIHGGGMRQSSCYDGNWSAWGRMIAANGVAVAMVDFRNALRPSTASEVAPYPAGLMPWI